MSGQLMRRGGAFGIAVLLALSGCTSAGTTATSSSPSGGQSPTGGGTCPPTGFKDPDGLYTVMQDPKVTKAIAPCSKIGSGAKVTMTYDGPADATLNYETYFIDPEGTVRQDKGASFQGSGGTYETDFKVFNRDLAGKAGFLKVTATTGGKVTNGGVTGTTTQVAMIPVLFEVAP